VFIREHDKRCNENHGVIMIDPQLLVRERSHGNVNDVEIRALPADCDRITRHCDVSKRKLAHVIVRCGSESPHHVFMRLYCEGTNFCDRIIPDELLCGTKVEYVLCESQLNLFIDQFYS